jgi:hypothetical protein
MSTAQPREWTADDLRTRFPTLGSGDVKPVQCSAPGAGTGGYANRDGGERRGCARVEIEVEPAEMLAIRFEHSWPPERDRSRAEELDARILEGICQALSRSRASARFGRIVTRSVVDYGAHSTPVAFSMAASMAVEDAIRRGGWDAVDPADETMALSGRRPDQPPAR